MKKYSLLSLILTNLVPVLGVVLLNWDLFSVLFFYWLESAVVGIFNIPKMLMAKRTEPAKLPGNSISPKTRKLSGIIFFFVHYSLFMLGHGLFIFVVFSPVRIDAFMIIIGLLSFAASHGISFVTNFIGKKEYERVTLSQQMVAPYKRIVIMHLSIIFCGFLINIFSAPVVTLIFLILAKIAIDVISHLREHSKLIEALNTSIDPDN
jgi:hypothetical protein